MIIAWIANLRDKGGMFVRRHQYRNAAMEPWGGLARAAGLPDAAPRIVRQWIKSQPQRKQTVLRLAMPTSGTVILKHMLSPVDRAQFDAVVSAQSAGAQAVNGVAGFRVPEILALDPDHQTFLMEDVAGETLFDILTNKADHLSAIQRAGAWLSAFHTATLQQRREFQPRFMARHLLRLADQAANGERRVPDPVEFGATCRIVAGCAAEFAGAETTIAVRHGDFNLRNLLLSDNQVSVLDFSPAQTLPVGYDIGRILLHYMLVFGDFSQLAKGEIVSKEIEHAFFQGYQLCTPNDPSYRYLSRVRLMQEWNVHYPTNWRQFRSSHQRYRRIRQLVQIAMGDD